MGVTGGPRRYVDVSQTVEMLPEVIEAVGHGEMFMLNLLKFRDVADYSATPGIAPPTPISGREAYEKYLALCQPGFDERGNGIFLKGTPGPYLIGPQDERWDMVLIISGLRLADAGANAMDDDYRAQVVGHRAAALEDSRLLPIPADR